MSAEKKISRRKLIYAGIGAAAAIAAGSLAAYYAMGPPAPPATRTTTGPRKGATINVLSIQDPFFFPMETLIENFEKETGIKVNLQAVAYDELHAKLVNSFLAKSPGIDVACVDQMWVAQYADSGWIIPLDEYIERDKKEVNMMDFIPSAVYSLCEWRGKIWTLPVAPYAQGVLYRVDVFDELGLEHPPTDVNKSADWTWDKYYELVKKINGKTVRGTRFYGTVICGAQPAPIVHMYTQLAASNGARWFKSFPEAPWDFEPLLNSPDNISSLEFYRKLYLESPPECINYLWFDAGMQFGMKGNVGLMYWWTPYFYLVTKAGYMVKEDSVLGIDGKPNYDKYRCALLPRNPAKTQVISVGGWSFGIPTYSANKEEAWEFIKWVTSAKTQKEMGLCLEPSPYQFADFPRKSLYEDRQLQEIYPWLPLQLKLFEGWDSPYKAIPSGKIVRPTVPIYVTLEGIYGLYLNKAVAGEMSATDALNTANSFSKTILEKNFYIPWKAESYNDTLEGCIELMKRLS
jgi:multiple sugar transport system substrate-binding protein